MSLHAFTIEHNYGHHKNVATELDPATAKRDKLVSLLDYLCFWTVQECLANSAEIVEK